MTSNPKCPAGSGTWLLHVRAEYTADITPLYSYRRRRHNRSKFMEYPKTNRPIDHAALTITITR